MVRPLKWWCCGWYSTKDFQLYYWIQDDFGTAVPTTRNNLALFHNMNWISPVAL